MKKLEFIAKLEQDYVLQRASEIDAGVSERKIFLASRGIRRQIKSYLRGAQQLERIHNRSNLFQQSNLIAKIVFENDVFEESRKMIGQGFRLHPKRSRVRKEKDATEYAKKQMDEILDENRNINSSKYVDYKALIWNEESKDDK
jgi:hypothetical protein